MSRRAPRRPDRRGDVGDASAEPSAAQEVPWREVFRRAPLATFLATGLGSGLLPKAPGTWGSVLAVLLGEGLFQVVGLVGVVGLAAVSTVAGVPVSGRVAALRGRKDPGEIVVDEIAGQAIALAGLHAMLPAGAPDPLRWGLVALAFLLFRVFDILKPGPVDRVQSLPGGWGVMADDLLAGALAGILVGAAAFLLS
ncbi:MAG: phosphatidylglycerophosphatase A [Holophagales bacterium]|nr:phosphatidylglycerophosphatase A [Holophagales bacterium]